MALWCPRAHGDDALRAIRAALEIQAPIPTLLTIDSGPLAVHVGIAMGEVVAGAVGSDRHRGYTVTGGAANVAARLSDRAVAGESWCRQKSTTRQAMPRITNPSAARA